MARTSKLDLSQEISKLKAENEQLKDMLVEERLPNYCTGVECGCAERVGEARKKDRIKLNKELEQALNPEIKESQ